MIARRVRLTVFFLCLMLYLLGAIGIYSINLPAAVSPFLWLTALLGGSVVYFIAVPALIILGLGLIKKRFFCRFLCPMGCSFEIMEKASRSCCKKPVIGKARKHFFQWNYFGKAFVLLTLFCVVLRIPGVNGFQFLDPLILFGMFFNFQSWNPLIFLTVFLLIFSAFRPHFWCVNFCPLGALQDMTYGMRGIVTSRSSRKKRNKSGKSSSDISEKEPQEESGISQEESQEESGISQEDSQKEQSEKELKKDLLSVNQKELADGSLKEETLNSAVEQSKDSSQGTGRRTFLLLIPFLFLLALGRKTVLQIQRTGRFFRPPGACADETQFTTLCTSCGRCIAVCPTKHLISIIDFKKNEKRSIGSVPDEQSSLEEKQSALSEMRSKDCQTRSGEFLEKTLPGKDHSFISVTAAGLPLLPSVYELTPVVETKSTYCDAKCNACSRVCPTGALRPFSIEKKKSLRIGIAKYEFDNCVLYNSKDCNICVRECPYEAIGLVWNEELYVNVPTVDPDKCTGCGRCVVFCPGFDPVWHGEEGEEEIEGDNNDNNDGSSEQNIEIGNGEPASDQNESDPTGLDQNESDQNESDPTASDQTESGPLANSSNDPESSGLIKSVEVKKQINSAPPKAFTIVSREEWEAMTSPGKN